MSAPRASSRPALSAPWHRAGISEQRLEAMIETRRRSSTSSRTLEKHRRRAIAGGHGSRGSNGMHNRARAEMYARAEFFAWSARRFDGCPLLGADPIGGRPHASSATASSHFERELGRAIATASARVCYRRARKYESPLPA